MIIFCECGEELIVIGGHKVSPTDGKYIRVRKCACCSEPEPEKITTCWYRQDNTWKTGFFHGWSQSYEEFENGPGNFPAAIIEDATDSHCHVVYAGYVSFNPDDPDPPLTEKQAHQVMDLVFSKKPARFRPRLIKIRGVWWAVQIHPEAIELFDTDGVYYCQVQWVDGEVRVPHGGLPIDQLREIFKKDS